MSKKISGEQFILDCINKEHEIVGAGLHWDTFEELRIYTVTHEHWYTDFSFITVNQYEEMKKYFSEHLPDYATKSYCRKKKNIEKEFSWFMLMYGLKYDFDLKELKLS